MLEAKLTVLKFQMKIKEELDSIASSLDDVQSITESLQNNSFLHSNHMADANFAIAAREKAKELSLELKSITQLYNEYAVPFRLWEVCSFH